MAIKLEIDSVPTPVPPRSSATPEQLWSALVQLHTYTEALRRDIATLRNLIDTYHP